MMSPHDESELSVRHIDVQEYAVGSERYERLIQQLEDAKRFQQPEVLAFNV